MPRPSSISPGRKPAIGLDCLLGDIGKYRIRASESYHRHVREEHGDPAEDVARSERRENTATGTSHRTRQTADTLTARATSDARVRAPPPRAAFPVPHHLPLWAEPWPLRPERRRPLPATEVPDDAGSKDDDRKRHAIEEDRHEGDGGERDHHFVPQRLAADPAPPPAGRQQAPQPSGRRTAPRRCRRFRTGRR